MPDTEPDTTGREPLTVEVDGCARCHGEHGEIDFLELTNPIDVGDAMMTHWAPCPTNGQPILYGHRETWPGRVEDQGETE